MSARNEVRKSLLRDRYVSEAAARLQAVRGAEPYGKTRVPVAFVLRFYMYREEGGLMMLVLLPGARSARRFPFFYFLL